MAAAGFHPDDDRYAPRVEIAAYFREINSRLDGQDNTLARIEKHTSETNGRVRKLEVFQARIEGATAARSWITPTLVALLTAIVGALAGHFLA
jgi:hypothetical protein